MEKENLNSREAALFMCVSLSKLWKMASNKELPYSKVGRINVFKRDNLEAYLKKTERPTIETLKERAEAQLFKSKPIGSK